MRKIFSFFAAMLVAIAANAAVVNITPDGATDLRHAVRDVAAAGDTVVLADGVYTQGGDYTYFDKNIVVMAAEGANPVVKFTVPAQIKGGARAEFVGIKFDMENLHGETWYEHLIYATDATEGNVLVFDGCEFYNDTLNNSVIYCSSSNLLDSIIVKDCKFHDIMKSCIFVESTAFKGLHISNSTFYNISTNTASYWAGVVDIRATGCELRVDHCTFYNVIPMNTDYSAVSKATIANGIVSNCIFMLPAAQDGIRAMRGVTANNCITYNYLKDSGTGIHSSVTKNNCTQVDPLFKDAANADFTLLENSPALTMNNGEPIGDLRWVAKDEPQPTHTYTVAGPSNVFGSNWKADDTNNDMVLQEDNTYKWEKTGLELLAGNIEFKVCVDHSWDVAYPASNYQLAIEETGVYTITIYYNPNDNNYVGAVATKTGSVDLDPTVAMKGGWDEWANEVAFTLSDDKLTATGTVALEPGDYEFKMILNGSDWRGNGYTYHRGYTGAEDINTNGNNMVLKADVAGQYVFTWTFATNAISIAFPSVATALDNIQNTEKTVKVIEHGQVLIRKNGRMYNVLGQTIR
ncbi:MAG: DUF5123 domain-containing protein [Paludibacteraceae bacterium]|nr:DUF5123 domain-containing protein [Paludibacteraceae bacterium]